MERERGRQTDRQTETDRDTQTDTERDRQTHRDSETERHRKRQADRQRRRRNGEKQRQKDTQGNRHTDREGRNLHVAPQTDRDMTKHKLGITGKMRKYEGRKRTDTPSAALSQFEENRHTQRCPIPV